VSRRWVRCFLPPALQKHWRRRKTRRGNRNFRGQWLPAKAELGRANVDTVRIADDMLSRLMMARGRAAASGRTPCIASHLDEVARHRSGRGTRARNPISSARFLPPVSAASKDTQRPVTFAGRLNPLPIGKMNSACDRLTTAPQIVCRDRSASRPWTSLTVWHRGRLVHSQRRTTPSSLKS
jgi:hypothetical protein